MWSHASREKQKSSTFVLNPKRIDFKNPIAKNWLGLGEVQYNSKSTYNGEFDDSLEGLSRPRPGQYSQTRTSLDGTLLYNVKYSIDSFGRRTWPNRKSGERFIIFLGCSFTLGEGVKDEEALPARLDQLQSGFTVYNYGFHGYGPHDVLERVRQEKWKDSVPEKHGIVVFVVIDDQIKRANASMTYVSSYGQHHLYMKEKQDGVFENVGAFKNAYPRLTNFYNWTSKLPLVEYFGIEFPLQWKKKHFERMVRLINATKIELEKSLTIDKFVVVEFPNSYLTASYFPKLLSDYGIFNLDYSNFLAQKFNNAYMFLADGHPSPGINAVLAQQLYEDLIK